VDADEVVDVDAPPAKESHDPPCDDCKKQAQRMAILAGVGGVLAGALIAKLIIAVLV
jgi:hypothetical protein